MHKLKVEEIEFFIWNNMELLLWGISNVRGVEVVN